MKLLHPAFLLPALSASLLVPAFSLATAGPRPDSHALAGSSLRSPWDAHPPVLTDGPYRCGPPPVLGQDMIVSGLQNKPGLSREVKNAAYAESSTAVNDVARRVFLAANDFLATGSRPAAACVIGLLSDAANQGAMTGFIADSMDLYYQNQALRAFSIAYLQVRDSGVASPQQTQAIIDWFEDIVREERSTYERENCGPNVCSLQSHRGIDTAAAAVAVGVAANDDRLVQWAYSRYRHAVSQIDGSGMLHYDLQGAYALKFTLESTAALIRIAEFGEANGMDLYSCDHDRIRLLAHTVALGLIDPTMFREASGRQQKIPATIQPWEANWAAVYVTRIPDPVLIGLLHQACPNGANMWERYP